ncbi:MAG: hypothetical protein K8R79_06000 [Calditrichales bacterium]|nr:hypothetical protein [Calditrichales bacterium]
MGKKNKTFPEVRDTFVHCLLRAEAHVSLYEKQEYNNGLMQKWSID